MDKIICYNEHNTEQCWYCANYDGIKITYMPIKMALGEVISKVALPICKIADLAMTYVNQTPCDCFKIRDRKANIDAIPHEMTARELLLTEERMRQEDEDAYRKYASLWWNSKVNEAAAFAEDWAKKHSEKKSEK